MALFIDCDPGIDDFMGLIYLMYNYSNKIVGVSSIMGNVNSGLTTKNAKLFVALANEYLNYEIPFYEGLSKPIFQIEYRDASEYHGSDGVGCFWKSSFCLDNQEIIDKKIDSVKINDRQAALAIIEKSKEYEGELAVLMLGPLSNLALAMIIDPQLGSRLQRVWIMGGNLSGRGNMANCPSAEFNFHTDPESAYLIFRDLQCDKVVLPIDPCWQFTIDMNQLDQWIGKGLQVVTSVDSDCHNVARQILLTLLQYKKTRNCNFNMYDLILSILVCKPELMENADKISASIETRGHFTRGMVVLDLKDKYKEEAFNGFGPVTFINKCRYEPMAKEIDSLFNWS